MKNGKSYDEVKVAEVFISGAMGLDDVKDIFGITKAQVKAAVRNNAGEAANRLVSIAYDTLEITDPYVFNRKPQDRPVNWSSKYTPSALEKKGTKINMAIEIIKTHHDEGTLTRDNRSNIVKEIQKKLNLGKSEATAKTYWADAKKLSGLHYTS